MHWGTITWIFFHTLAEKIKEDRFEEHKAFLFGVVTSLCHCLPCPDCRAHAVKTLREHPMGAIKTKAQFKSYLHSFHNSVNVRRKKKPKGADVLEKYSSASLPRSFVVLKTHFRTTSPRLMLEQMTRVETLNSLTQQMRANAHLFDL